jgi:hypothetical protein
MAGDNIEVPRDDPELQLGSRHQRSIEMAVRNSYIRALESEIDLASGLVCRPETSFRFLGPT